MNMDSMNLEDALGGWPSGGGNNQSGGGGPWPGQPTNPTWPGGPGGQPGANPTWPGGPGGQPGTNPTWPGGPGGQPGANPTWPGGPGGQPGGGGGAWPSQPSQPGWPSPSPQPPAPGPGPGYGPGPGHGPAPQQNLVVPYKQKLPGGVHDKLLITIAGNVKPNANKFAVDLGTDHDLALHINPRFNESGRKVVVRNSRIRDKWGTEERELQHFPFQAGQPFEMKIMCTSREFRVAVNNSHLLSYHHRVTNLKSITGLSVHGDLTLSRVQVETLH